MLDITYTMAYITDMDTTNWTDKQRKAYEMLRASVAANEARRLNQPSILNKAPKGGWSDTDRIAK